MSKIGVSLNLNLSKIDKSKIVQGKSGKYLNLTAFIDTEKEDQYGNHGAIAHSLSKEERQSGDKGAIIGNAKVFWNPSETSKPTPKPTPQADDDFNDDIPF